MADKWLIRRTRSVVQTTSVEGPEDHALALAYAMHKDSEPTWKDHSSEYVYTVEKMS